LKLIRPLLTCKVYVPSGLAIVRLYWVRLSASSVATEGNDGPVMLGRIVTPVPEPESTNLSGSVGAAVTAGRWFVADAAGRFVPWPLEPPVVAATAGTVIEVAMSTRHVAVLKLRRI
jgi:hypothetical protein